MTPGQVDYYGIDELLTEEERITQASVRSFVEREALPVIEGCHAREEFPRELILRMAALGVFGANLQGYGWILSGTKRWITNGSIADLSVVWAKDGDTIRGFLVERGVPGFSAHDIKGKFSLRASITSELVLEDVRVPAASLLPDAEGLGGPFSCLNQARYGIAWGALGAARTCYLTALRYAQERRQFDRPIAGYQLVQQKLVHMLTEVTKGQLLAWRLGRMKDAGTMRPEQVSLAKRANVAAALETARLARDILGANGIVNEYPVIRHMLNLETVSTYEGTHDMHTLIVGRDITGLDAIR